MKPDPKVMEALQAIGQTAPKSQIFAALMLACEQLAADFLARPEQADMSAEDTQAQLDRGLEMVLAGVVTFLNLAAATRKQAEAMAKDAAGTETPTTPEQQASAERETAAVLAAMMNPSKGAH